MALALEKLLIPVTGQPGWSDVQKNDNRLEISVVFTSVKTTLAALREAGALASSLGARITLLVMQAVPFPLPLESPPVLLDWNEHRFRVIASESPVETSVRLYLCRDKLETLKDVLKPKSLVVIGAANGWYPFTRERRMARNLRRAGHEVVLTKSE